MNKSSLEALFPIQDVDSRLDQLQKASDHLYQSSGAKELSSQLHALKADIEASRTNLRKLYKERDDLEAKSSALIEKVKKIKAQEQSGSISHRDIASTEAEISNLEAQRSSLEDQELVILTEIDQAEVIAERLKGEFDSVGADLNRRLKDNEAKLIELSGEMEKLRSEKEALKVQVDPTLIGIYESVRNRVSTSPIARIENSICQGCRLKMSSAEVQGVRLQLSADFSRPPTCEQCGRILFI